MSRAQRPDVGRRRFLAGAVTAGAGALLGRRLAAAEPASAAALPLITRPIPSSGERLPAIGIGTDSFAESARDAIRAELAHMRELGGTVIDTAAAYGDSEALIGEGIGTDADRRQALPARGNRPGDERQRRRGSGLGGRKSPTE